MTTTTDPAQFTGTVRGAVVRYHGSLTTYHGDCILLTPGVLQTVAEGELLLRVRRQSYDPVPVPVADIVRKGVNDRCYHWTASTDPGRAACGRTRLDDGTAALPERAYRTGYDSHCARPACARRWAAWHRQVEKDLQAALAG